jgi:hypothetical protein
MYVFEHMNKYDIGGTKIFSVNGVNPYRTPIGVAIGPPIGFFNSYRGVPYRTYFVPPMEVQGAPCKSSRHLVHMQQVLYKAVRL